MPQYTALLNLNHDQRPYTPGAVVTIDDERVADYLIKRGAIAPTTAKLPAPSDEAPASDKLNLNTATKTQLTDLPHIGAATAAKLIKARPIESLEAALTASELAPEKWDEIAGGLRV